MWIPLSILLLFDSGQFALSKVVTVDQPTQLFDCKDQEYSLLHKCAINGLQNKSETWEDSNDGLVQVKVKQNFFWHPVKRVRRECRTLSKRERGELWDAINALKKDEVIKRNHISLKLYEISVQYKNLLVINSKCSIK